MNTTVVIPFCEVDDNLATLAQLALMETAMEEHMTFTFPPTPDQGAQTLDVQIWLGRPPYAWNEPCKATAQHDLEVATLLQLLGERA